MFLYANCLNINADSFLASKIHVNHKQISRTIELNLCHLRHSCDKMTRTFKVSMQ